jgi:hypothetical protein
VILVRQAHRARIVCSVAAFLSFLLTVFLWFTGHREEGLVVGLWVPSILSSGSLLIPPNGVKRE